MNADGLIAHFDRVASTAEGIPRLRAFVLDLAVRGALTATAPRKSQNNDCAPFEIPAPWRWATVAELADCRLGKMLDKAKNRGTSRRYLRNINVRWFDFDLDDVKEMPFEDSEIGEFALRTGDVLACEGGEPGRAAVWDDREPGVLFQKALHRVRLGPDVDPHYFVLVLRQAADSGRLAEGFTGATFKHLTGAGLAGFNVPVPPIAEQREIVRTADELMGLCDELEDNLIAAGLVRAELLDALLYEALK